MALKLTSPAFPHGEEIPIRYSSSGQNVSPPLAWSNIPAGTEEFALICEDPDAPLPRSFVHWIIYGLSANTTALPEGIPRERELRLPVLARQGLNSLFGIGYTGPAPPPWHGPHRYQFRLFALRGGLPLLPGVGRGEFLKALEPYVIEEATLMGCFERPWHKRRSREAA